MVFVLDGDQKDVVSSFKALDKDAGYDKGEELREEGNSVVYFFISLLWDRVFEKGLG